MYVCMYMQISIGILMQSTEASKCICYVTVGNSGLLFEWYNLFKLYVNVFAMFLLEYTQCQNLRLEINRSLKF